MGGGLTVDDAGVWSNADKSNLQSKQYAAAIAHRLRADTTQERAAGQTLGGKFEQAVVDFLSETFPAFAMLRPGDWSINRVGNAGRKGGAVSSFIPYAHLRALDDAVKKNPDLLSVLGNAYAISPDVIITRAPVPDSAINATEHLVDDLHGVLSAIRERGDAQDHILHAVVSCKWTLRSDRAQNARSEALNLIRNRKGRTPHIAVVTAEPTPARISSLALGTGDIDCVYHFALPELREAVAEFGTDESKELLSMMIAGDRLKDITDLVLDLTI